MAQPSALNPSFPPPHIDPAHLEAFHGAHFSTGSVNYFSTHFLGSVLEDEAQNGDDDDDDDGLGYYPDGVKRTLTDEQIAMFRHSEIQALLRERWHARENKATPARDDDKAAETEEGELEDDEDVPAPDLKRQQPVSTVEHPNAATWNAKRQKAEQRKGRGHKQLPKPDLRKRTWDKVDHGLQSLDYGEKDDGAAALPVAPQRRKISYEDI